MKDNNDKRADIVLLMEAALEQWLVIGPLLVGPLFIECLLVGLLLALGELIDRQVSSLVTT